jgi:CheY-like chemotaxis protein
MSDILLIDDMKSVRRAVSSVLKGRGHVVTAADDGNKGMDLLRSGMKFDLVITDVLMPECDGTEVIVFLDTLPEAPAGPRDLGRRQPGLVRGRAADRPLQGRCRAGEALRERRSPRHGRPAGAEALREAQFYHRHSGFLPYDGWVRNLPPIRAD